MEDKRTTRARERFYKDLDKEGFTLAEGNEFVNSSTYLYIVCPEGHTIRINPNKFQQGRRCPECSKRVKKTIEDFKKEVNDLAGEEYIVLGNYVNTFTPILMKHNKCGKKIKISRDNFLKGKRCKDCSYKQNGLNRKWTQEELEKRIAEEGNYEYSVCSDYTNSKDKILIKHDVCGYEWWTYSKNFLHHGTRCPSCVSVKSTGEELIKEYLDRHKIHYLFQATFEDLRHTRVLAFDFYIPERNLLIEYDGKQHFEPVEYFGGVKAFEDRQYKDNLKNEYARNNKINLLRIPYYEDVNELLRRFLF